MRSCISWRSHTVSGWATLAPCIRFYSSSSQFGGKGNREQEPVKDRFPPKALDPANPKRKLAVLVDAQNVDAHMFCKTVEPAMAEVGVPVLIRVFDYELSREWNTLIAQSSGRAKPNVDSSELPRRVTTSGPEMEWFRVERFIPLSMQMAADANHIFEYKHFNQVDAVCFVCTELDRPHFEAILERLRGRNFNQYILDELGLVVEVNCDGRSRDGSSRS
jgi:hypothetical protein